MRSMTASIAIEDWKRPIFERHLAQAGFQFTAETSTSGTTVLKVEATDLDALGLAVRAAKAEAAT